MIDSPMKRVIQNLRRVALREGTTGLTDGELLTRFIEQRDELSFEALVRRHGPMVLGVCQRVLHNQHDAEDAFQATFLVLVRKAASVVPRNMVGNWLYGVARTTAFRAKAAAVKRRVKERKAMEKPRSEAAQSATWDDMQVVLDQELGRLPDKYRIPIVLCDLENKSIREAARLLGWPQGTLAGRLARGRKMLAARLARRGFALSGGLLAAMLAQNALACLPLSLVSSTIKAATSYEAGRAAVEGLVSAKVVALAEGVLRAMLMTKVKVVTATILLAALAWCGIGVLTHSARAEGRSKSAESTEARMAKPSQPVKLTTLRIRVDLEAINALTHTITASYWHSHELDRTLAGAGQKGSRSFGFFQAKLTDLPVAKDAKIRDAGKEIKFADLRTGTRVTLELAVDQAGLIVVDIQKENQDAAVHKPDRKMFPNGSEYDFGVMPRGTQPEYVFPIINTSDAPLQLLSVRLSCGCLKASVNKKLLKPNERAELTIALDTRRFVGPKSASAYLTTGSGSAVKEFRFSVSAHSRD